MALNWTPGPQGLQREGDQFRRRVRSAGRDHQKLFALMHVGHGRCGRIVRQRHFAHPFTRALVQRDQVGTDDLELGHLLGTTLTLRTAFLAHDQQRLGEQ
jgi:hypothetical protein